MRQDHAQRIATASTSIVIWCFVVMQAMHCKDGREPLLVEVIDEGSTLGSGAQLAILAPITEPSYRAKSTLAIWSEPRVTSRRIGTLAAQTRVGPQRLVLGEGCLRGWFQLNPHGFVCSDEFEASSEMPSPPEWTGQPGFEKPLLFGKTISPREMIFALQTVSRPVASSLPPAVPVAPMKVAPSAAKPARKPAPKKLPPKKQPTVMVSPPSGQRNVGSARMQNVAWMQSSEVPPATAPSGPVKPSPPVGLKPPPVNLPPAANPVVTAPAEPVPAPAPVAQPTPAPIAAPVPVPTVAPAPSPIPAPPTAAPTMETVETMVMVRPIGAMATVRNFETKIVDGVAYWCIDPVKQLYVLRSSVIPAGFVPRPAPTVVAPKVAPTVATPPEAALVDDAQIPSKSMRGVQIQERKLSLPAVFVKGSPASKVTTVNTYPSQAPAGTAAAVPGKGPLAVRQLPGRDFFPVLKIAMREVPKASKQASPAPLNAVGAKTTNAKNTKTSAPVVPPAPIPLGYQLAAGEWILPKNSHLVLQQRPPRGVGADEHWLDVDLDQQVLVAYIGEAPVFATLISSGVAESPTPTGIYRISKKSLMTELGTTGDAPGSPGLTQWVMMFAPEFGWAIQPWFEGDRLGSPASRGSILVSADDAQWLYKFTSPESAPGWLMAVGNADYVGTVVRVHSAKDPTPPFKGYAAQLVNSESK